MSRTRKYAETIPHYALYCTLKPTRRLSSPRPSVRLAAIGSALTAIRAALAPLLAHKAAAQHRQARSQAAPVLLLLRRRPAPTAANVLPAAGPADAISAGPAAVLHAALGSAVTVR
jgi:hypothetical protein